MNFTHSKNQIALFNDEGGLLAEITFPKIDDTTVNINHTFVDESLRGQGIAGKLMTELVQELTTQKLTAVPTCSYAVGWFDKHPEYSHLVKK